MILSNKNKSVRIPYTDIKKVIQIKSWIIIFVEGSEIPIPTREYTVDQIEFIVSLANRKK